MERITEDMREKLEKMRKMKINAAVLSTSYFEGNKTNCSHVVHKFMSVKEFLDEKREGLHYCSYMVPWNR